MEKTWNVYTMEYYSPIKMNEILLFATIWLDLKGIMLSKVRQRKTDHMLSFIHELKNKQTNNKFIDRTDLWLPEAEGQGREECVEKVKKKIINLKKKNKPCNS